MTSVHVFSVLYYSLSSLTENKDICLGSLLKLPLKLVSWMVTQNVPGQYSKVHEVFWLFFLSRILNFCLKRELMVLSEKTNNYYGIILLTKKHHSDLFLSYFEPHQVIETGKTAWNFGSSYYTKHNLCNPLAEDRSCMAE